MGPKEMHSVNRTSKCCQLGLSTKNMSLPECGMYCAGNSACDIFEFEAAKGPVAVEERGMCRFWKLNKYKAPEFSRSPSITSHLKKFVQMSGVMLDEAHGCALLIE